MQDNHGGCSGSDFQVLFRLLIDADLRTPGLSADSQSRSVQDAGLGGYLAGKTEIDHYNAELAREYQEVEDLPHR